MEKTYQYSEENINEEDPRGDILIELSEYADRNPKFDAKFLDSVRNMFDKHGYMSKNQYNVLVNIYNSIWNE